MRAKKLRTIIDAAIEDTLASIPTSNAVSEGIVKRDYHFHSCWMLLKSERSDLWEAMTRVELIISNYPDPNNPPEPEQADAEKEPERMIL